MNNKLPIIAYFNDLIIIYFVNEMYIYIVENYCDWRNYLTADMIIKKMMKYIPFRDCRNWLNARIKSLRNQ